MVQVFFAFRSSFVKNSWEKSFLLLVDVLLRVGRKKSDRWKALGGRSQVDGVSRCCVEWCVCTRCSSFPLRILGFQTMPSSHRIFWVWEITTNRRHSFFFLSLPRILFFYYYSKIWIKTSPSSLFPIHIYIYRKEKVRLRVFNAHRVNKRGGWVVPEKLDKVHWEK